MAIIMPGDAMVLKSYGFTENIHDPLRFNQRIGNIMYVVQFISGLGWRLAITNVLSIRKSDENYYKTLKEALDEFEKIRKGYVDEH